MSDMIRLEFTKASEKTARRSIRFLRPVNFGWMEAIVLTPETVMEMRSGEDTLVNSNAADLEGIPASVFLMNQEAFPLPAKESLVGIAVKKMIPQEIILQCWKIFAAGYKHDRNEWTCFVRMHRTEPDRWDIVIPPQRRSGSLVEVEAKILVSTVMHKDWWVVGNFHSHPFGHEHAFLSGTDRDNVDVFVSAVAGSFNFTPSLGTFGEMACQISGFGNVDPKRVVADLPAPGFLPEGELPDYLQAAFLAETVRIKDLGPAAHHGRMQHLPDQREHSNWNNVDRDIFGYSNAQGGVKTPPGLKPPGTRSRRRKKVIQVQTPSGASSTTTGVVANAGFRPPSPVHALTLELVNP